MKIPDLNSCIDSKEKTEKELNNLSNKLLNQLSIKIKDNTLQGKIKIILPIIDTLPHNGIVSDWKSTYHRLIFWWY